MKSVWKMLIAEALVYGALMIAYFFLVLRFLREPLLFLFHHNLPVYAVLALVLIAAQGILLAMFTSFLIQRLFPSNH